MQYYNQIVESPFGRWESISDGRYLTKISFVRDLTINESPHPITQLATKQLEEYFSLKRKVFNLPLRFEKGTEFQKEVWSWVSKVPYGATFSYKDIAEDLNNPGSVRAVGAANGQNPFPLVIPCHRIIGSDGSLTGYAYGKELKRKLLILEKAISPGLLDSL